MANQVEVPKLNMPVLTGKANVAENSKLVMYILLEPGASGPDTSNRQGHVHTQIIRRD